MTLPNTTAGVSYRDLGNLPGYRALQQRQALLSSCAFMLYNSKDKQAYLINPKRTRQRLSPASTFKFHMAALALDAGLVQDYQQIIPYPGPPKPFMAEWAHDMSLKEAFHLSNVPVFQSFARKIGAKRLQAYIRQIGYGNQHMLGRCDEYWLNHSLKISAAEQCLLLVALAEEQLPLSKYAQKQTALLARVQPPPLKSCSEFCAKTGLSRKHPGSNTQTGWYVGWFKINNTLYSFAYNQPMQPNTPLQQRKDLCLELIRLALQAERSSR